MKISTRMPLQAWKCRLLTHWTLLIILVFATFMFRVVLKGRVSACCLTTLGSCLATSSGLPSISPVVVHLKRSSRMRLHYEVKTKLSSARGFSALQNIQVSIVSDGEQTIACLVSLTFLNLTVSWNFYLGEFVHVCKRGELERNYRKGQLQCPTNIYFLKKLLEIKTFSSCMSSYLQQWLCYAVPPVSSWCMCGFSGAFFWGEYSVTVGAP